MDTEESDVDFWGRVSPSRRTQPVILKEGGGSSEEDDDDDENMSDTDDLEEDELDEGDRMEIFGHR